MAIKMGPMDGVREYSETGPVELGMVDGRPVIVATNQGGHDCTQVDLVDLMHWVNEHFGSVDMLCPDNMLESQAVGDS